MLSKSPLSFLFWYFHLSHNYINFFFLDRNFGKFSFSGKLLCFFLFLFFSNCNYCLFQLISCGQDLFVLSIISHFFKISHSTVMFLVFDCRLRIVFTLIMILSFIIMIRCFSRIVFQIWHFKQFIGPLLSLVEVNQAIL